MSTQHAGRRTTSSPLRRATHYVLGAGIILAAAAALGPIWLVRAGVAVVVIAAVIAVRLAWKEMAAERTEAGLKSLDQLLVHNKQLSAERTRNSEVLDALRHHNEDNDHKVVELQVRIGQLRTELSSLRGDNAALQADVIERDHRIKRLTTDLAAREAELKTLTGTEDDAQVLAMPLPAEQPDWDALPSAEDLWSDGNHPTVVDLQALVFPPAEEEIRKQA